MRLSVASQVPPRFGPFSLDRSSSLRLPGPILVAIRTNVARSRARGFGRNPRILVNCRRFQIGHGREWSCPHALASFPERSSPVSAAPSLFSSNRYLSARRRAGGLDRPHRDGPIHFGRRCTRWVCWTTALSHPRSRNVAAVHSAGTRFRFPGLMARARQVVRPHVAATGATGDGISNQRRRRARRIPRQTWISWRRCRTRRRVPVPGANRLS